jgi:WD40 repeat protein
VVLWEADRAERDTLPAHPEEVTSLAFGNDDRTLVTVDKGGTVKLWDAVTGRELAAVRAAERAVALDAAGRTLASGTAEGRVELWDLATGRQRLAFDTHAGPVGVLNRNN